MLFTSYEFLIFLCAVLILYYILPKRMQWGVLLVSSYLFYCFNGIESVAFILATTISTYFFALIISKRHRNISEVIASRGEFLSKEERKALRAKSKSGSFKWLCLGLCLNFGMLGVIKYTAFAFTNLNSLLHFFGSSAEIDVPSLIMPLGISFYIFKTMSYLIDVYRGKAQPETNLGKFALFVSFFPQLIQGPISRFDELAPSLFAEHKFDIKKFTFGLQRVVWGYFKKLVIADRILIAISAMLEDPEAFQGVYVVLMIVLYSVEIYADFTGGIDITIGIAEAMGIQMAENFDHPFFSKSTKEYWRRWHITMGTWFTDYVFYPLSVCRPMLKISKKSREVFGPKIGKRIPVYLATLTTWFLTGLWHGAGWNFIVWGLLNSVIILVSQELSPVYDKFHKKFPGLSPEGKYGVFMMLRTFLLMGTIRVLDCYRNVPLTFKMLSTIFYRFNYGDLFHGALSVLGLNAGDWLVIFIGCIIMFVVSFLGLRKSVRERLWERPIFSNVLFGSLILCIIVLGAYGIGYEEAQFIYNQF